MRKYILILILVFIIVLGITPVTQAQFTITNDFFKKIATNVITFNTQVYDLLIDNNNELRLGEADGSGANYIGFNTAARTTDLTLSWDITAATCSGDGNLGALTINGSNQIICSADDGAAGAGDSITVVGVAATDPDFIDGDIDWTLDTAATPDTIAATVACSGCIDATDLATDSVSADELNATGVEAELETTLDIAGDVSSTGMATTVIGADKVLESHLKAVDAAVDEEVLTFESTTGDFEWETCAEITGGAGLCDGIDADSGGSTAWSAIGDAAADGSIDFVATQQDIIGQLDAIGQSMLTLTNQDADTANNTSILTLAANDGADANVFYFECIGDADVGATVDCRLAQSATGMAFTLGSAGVVLSDDGDGALTLLGAGNGFDEDLTFNLDDTTNEVTISSSTGVATINLSSLDITIGGGDILTGNIALRIGDATTDTITLTTDGTGDGEVVLPAGSISLAETAITAGRSLTIATNDIAADAELRSEEHTS